MKLSTRVRYGVRAMIELAKQEDGEPIALRRIAKNQAISPKYLEQMAAVLKLGGLIESVRGAEGGYRLARPAEAMTVWDVYTVLDSGAAVSDYPGERCQRTSGWAAQELWCELSTIVSEKLKSKTLRELADRESELEDE